MSNSKQLENDLTKFKRVHGMKEGDNPYPYPPTHFLIDGEMVPANKCERIDGNLIKIKD